MDPVGKIIAPILLALTAVAYLVAKWLEHNSGGTKIVHDVVDHVEVVSKVDVEKIDLDGFKWVCFWVAWIAVVWTVNVYNVFDS